VDLTGVEWHKSSFSNGNSDGEGCVEVGLLADGSVAVRDSKDRSLRPHVFTSYGWKCFVAGVHAGEFGQPKA
jgi:hypothetical protein